MNHQWIESDDLVAFYIYKFGIDKLPYTFKDIAESRGMSAGSLRMRIGNFKAIDGKGGLSHYGKRSEAVYDRYRNSSESELRRMAFPEL